MTRPRTATKKRQGLSLEELNRWYSHYNRRRYRGTDPVHFLHGYKKACDKEIVGIIASSLAYGRVPQINKSIDEVLSRLTDPAAALAQASRGDLTAAFRGFKHRFTTDREMISFLHAVAKIVRRHGSLGACFSTHRENGQKTVLPALTAFADELTDAAGDNCRSLIPRPSRGSACKRLNLYLRWMVRKDNIDVGLWRDVPTGNLIVPLDTHMHRFALRYRLTDRRSADMKAALEITRAFGRISPADPVRYDFALTRQGIMGNENERDI
jgi:uncharacterized protein (TIGR02757 family)